MADDSPKVIRLVRQFDQTRRDLINEQRRSGILKAQNDRLRRAVAVLQRRQTSPPEAAAKVG